MHVVVLASLLCVAVAAPPPPNTRILFENFVAKYKRHYATEFEKDKRFQIFSENIDVIYASNTKNLSYTLGVTANTDRTFEEWRAKYLTASDKPALSDEQNGRPLFEAPKEFTEPESVDWVAKGGVTSVKSQGSCGSCWTFATAGALEGAMFVSGRPIVDLSMQHLLACDRPSDFGCSGGIRSQAIEWVVENGITALKDEPYLCEDDNAIGCRQMTCSGSQPLVLAVGDVVKNTDVAQTELALEAAVAQQPVSVGIEAAPVFMHYTGGVLVGAACGSSLNHAVLAVGYGVDNGIKYWKLKNSWGEDFGENGYIRIEKGSAASLGQCGIRKRASFATVKEAASVVV